MKHRLFTIIFLLSYLILLKSNGQISIPEEIKSKCPETPLNERIRVTVADFAYSAGGERGRTLENFAAMLSNALFNINCYRVLSMLKDNDQLEGGMGRALKPQVVVTGEITEYSHVTKASSMVIAKKVEISAHIGYVIQVKNNFTGDILFSESRNVEGNSSNSSLQMNVKAPKGILSRVATGSIGTSEEGDNIKAAYQDALEKAIIEAVEVLVDKHPKVLENLAGNTAEDMRYAQQVNSEETLLKINNASFQKLTQLESKLKGASWIQEVQKKLSNGQGSLNIFHTGNQDDLITVIESLGSLFEIIGLDDRSITLKELK